MVQNRDNVHEVDVEKAKPDDPTTEFIRFLIDRWEKDGKLLKDLAAAAELAKSMPSQIKAGTSAASFYSAAKLARPLGYADLPALVVAAWDWWRSGDRSVVPAAASATDPQAEALRIIQSYGVTQAQVARVLDRYPRSEYSHKDTLWWLAKFHEARSDDADRASVARGDLSSETSARRVRKRTQAEVREAKAKLNEARQPTGARRKRAG